MDDPVRHRGIPGDRIVRVERKEGRWVSGSYTIVKLLVLNPANGEYVEYRKLINQPKEVIDRVEQELRTAVKTAKVNLFFNPDIYQKSIDNTRTWQAQRGAGGGAKPDLSSLTGTEKKAAIGAKKKEFLRFSEDLVGAFVDKRFDEFKWTPVTPKEGITKALKDDFETIAKMNLTMRKMEKDFTALGGYKNTNWWNVQKTKLSRVKKDVGNISIVGVEKCMELIAATEKLLLTSGLSDQQVIELSEIVERLVDALPDDLGRPLAKRMGDFNKALHSKKLPGPAGKRGVAPGRGAAKLDEKEVSVRAHAQVFKSNEVAASMSVEQRAESVFGICNDLISDDDLSEDGPFRKPGNLIKYEHAFDLFTRGQMVELEKYLYAEEYNSVAKRKLSVMDRDDLCSFVKLMVRKSGAKINRSTCPSLGRLIQRTLSKPSNRLTKSTLSTAFKGASGFY